MTKRPDILRLSITDPVVRDALRGLVTAAAAIGRNGVPSVSELARRIGVAYEYAPERTDAAILDVFQIAAEAAALDGEVMPTDGSRDPFERDADGNITAVRLYYGDGTPVTLADARAADPAQFWQFAAAMVGGKDEEADDDGRPYTLRDAAAVNPSEYVKFLKAGHGFREEEE